MEVKFKPVSLIQLNEIELAVKQKYDLTVPTYIITLPNDETQEFKHTVDSIQDAKTTTLEKEQWEKYQENLTAYNEEVGEKRTAYMLYEGIDCEPTDEWKDKQKWLGIQLPDNQFDLKVRFVRTELLKTPQEWQSAFIQIMQLSSKGADSAKIKAAENMFSGSLSDK